MATIYIGSARHDENGKYVGGAAGDQLQKSSTNDTVGEVSMQTMYKHSKGWLVARLKSVTHANKAAVAMKQACNNADIGYDQNGRLGIITYGTATKTKTECDCGTLVRECIKEATEKDPGNFTTADEISKLKATGLFEEPFEYVSQEKTPIYNGDVLVTKTKGHTVIVVSGNPRSASGSTYSGIFPVLPSRGYFKYGDGITTLTSYKTQIKRVQRLVNWINDGSIDVDGQYGSDTRSAVKDAQKKMGMTAKQQDGEFGSKTLAKAKTVKK